jgi:two-component system response regulator AtoC
MAPDINWRGIDERDAVEVQRAFPPPRLVESSLASEPAPAATGDVVRRSSAVTVTASDPLVDRVACSRLSVLIIGETGAGKEVLARRLHERSPRAAAPFVAVNAAAVCETLLESELFGHERGAFTGAVGAKAGLIEAADGGTLFLDEIGDMSMSAQAKMLRVLENRVVTRVGGLRARALDVRFIAATNQDLRAAVAAGKFREDLLFRLEGIELQVPPLRARVSEILPAARQFLMEQAVGDDMPLAVFSEAAERALLDYDWPGNFRELRNVVERAAVICDEGRIESADLLLPEARAVGDLDPQPSTGPAADERKRIMAALSVHAGNQTRAARLLGMSRRSLITRLQALGIARPRGRLRALTSSVR